MTAQIHSARRLVVTGFPPFPGRASNPTRELISSLDAFPIGIAGGVCLSRLLPVEYRGVEQAWARILTDDEPDAVLSFGVGRQSAPLRLETVARNRDAAEIPDNAGEVRVNQPICANGPLIWRSSLPLGDLRTRLRLAGLAAELGDDAGGYVCNHLTYVAGCAADERRIPFLFIHVSPAPGGVTISELRHAVSLAGEWLLRQRSEPTRPPLSESPAG